MKSFHVGWSKLPALNPSPPDAPDPRPFPGSFDLLIQHKRLMPGRTLLQLRQDNWGWIAVNCDQWLQGHVRIAGAFLGFQVTFWEEETQLEDLGKFIQITYIFKILTELCVLGMWSGQEEVPLRAGHSSILCIISFLSLLKVLTVYKEDCCLTTHLFIYLSNYNYY